MNSLNPLRFTSHKKNWEKCLLFQSWNDCLLNWAKWQLFSLKIVLGCHLSEKWCRFVNLLSFASSYFFLSLRKIMWPNSQDFLLRTQNEAPGLKGFLFYEMEECRLVGLIMYLPSQANQSAFLHLKNTKKNALNLVTFRQKWT